MFIAHDIERAGLLKVWSDALDGYDRGGGEGFKNLDKCFETVRSKIVEIGTGKQT